ncbi:MAG: enoyl-CoA hydratase [Luteibaculaceae bacterium]|jgi:enoyl-CoA hydratase
MTFDNILFELEEKVAIITINRPSKLNALNKATIAELSTALDEVNSNAGIRAAIITGSGDKSFVAGADISEFSSFSSSQGQELAQLGHNSLFNKIESLSKPVIAAINGFALGGGLELAMAAHVRVASDNAKLGLPEVSLGVIPGYGGTQRLPQLVGKGKAMELITTAGMMNAEESKEWGLVNHVVPQEELLPLAKKIAAKMVKNSGSAIAAAIRAVNANFTDGVDGYKVEVEQFGACFGTAEFVEGTTAFLEKRKPTFN